MISVRVNIRIFFKFELIFCSLHHTKILAFEDISFDEFLGQSVMFIDMRKMKKVDTRVFISMTQPQI